MATTSDTTAALTSWDIAVILAYLLGSIALGLWTVVKNKASLLNTFLAGRQMTWWPIALSVFASNIGCVNFVGLAGSAASSGLALVFFEWNAVPMLVLLGWLFLPVYLSSGIYTMPEYLALRFGGKRLRIYLSIIALLTYLLATVSSDLYTGALFMNQGLKLNFNVSIIILLGITLIFTGLGGLETVILTDALAVFVIVIGGFALCVIGLLRVDGLSGLQEKYMSSVPNLTITNETLYLVNTTCGHPRADAWHIFRHPWTADYPSIAMMIRTSFGTLWFWCANQLVVQRSLAAKNITHGKASCVLACYLKLTPMFIMILPGMISRALFPNEVACADPTTCMEVCGSELSCSNIALPKLALSLLPIGIRGLYVAAMIAATVSTLTSVINSGSALFSVDIWHSIRKNASERELLIAGRIFVVVMITLSIIWIPVMANSQGGQIYSYLAMAVGLLGAPTCTVFFLAIIWRRCNEQGAFWGMVVAQVWGVVRFVMDIAYPPPRCGLPDDRPLLLSEFNGYYHSVSQLVLAAIVAIIVSLATKPQPKEQMAGVTFWTRHQKMQSDLDQETKTMETALNEKPIGSTESYLNEKKADADGSYLNEKTTRDDDENCDDKLYGLEADNADPESKRSILTTIWAHLSVSVCGSKSLGLRAGRGRDTDPYDVRMARISETRFWKRFMDAQAVLVIVVTCVLYGLFF